MNPKTVLIVDDNEHDRIICQRALAETGWQLIEAATVSSGLALLATSKPDVVLLDFRLPDGTGIDFLSRIADIANSPPVIVLTGANDVSIAVEAMKAGAVDFYVKDMFGAHGKILKWAIRRALHESEARVTASHAEQEIRLAKSVLRHISDGVVVTDPLGNIVSANPAYCALTGYTAEQLHNESPKILRSERHDAGFFKAMSEAVSQTDFWQGKLWIRRQDGEEFLANLTISAIRNDMDVLESHIGVLNRITESSQS